jgi:thioredoxin-related protein
MTTSINKIDTMGISKKLMFFLFITCWINVHAQEDTSHKGIRFEETLSWEQVKQRAKEEGKYIFVDCYTTWCTPCKAMDKNVYPDQSVGEFFNRNFISVKVQMDQTDHDNSKTQKWYHTAKYIESEFKVDAYPTFLFFSPNGDIVHRAAGGYPPVQFIGLGKNALDTNKQYYRILEKYNPKLMDTSQLKSVALKYQSDGPELAGIMVNEYFKRLKNDKWTTDDLAFLQHFSNNESVKPIAKKFIDALNDNEDEIYKREIVRFLASFTKNSTDKGFNVFYKKPEKADSAMGQARFSRNLVVNIIIKENIDPVIQKNTSSTKEPNWNQLVIYLEKKYKKDYVLSAIMNSKIAWFQSKNDSNNYRKTLIEYLDKFVTWEDDFWLNHLAWSFFKTVNDPSLLQKALTWSREAIFVNPNYNWMDTYANLLYKLGKKREAIVWEQTAAKLEPRAKDIQENLEKMKTGLPTWPQRKEGVQQ